MGDFPSHRVGRRALLLAGVALASLAAGSARAGPAATARIVIPRIGVNVPLASTVDGGPHVFFHDRDTVAIAGHRTTHTRPFHNLPALHRGDAIRVGTTRYIVSRKVVVRPWQVWVLRYRGLVLSTCHPAGSAAYRFVILAKPALRG